MLLLSSWYSVSVVCSSTSCRKLHLSIWVEQCSLYQLHYMTLSMISLHLYSVDEMLSYQNSHTDCCFCKFRQCLFNCALYLESGIVLGCDAHSVLCCVVEFLD